MSVLPFVLQAGGGVAGGLGFLLSLFALWRGRGDAHWAITEFAHDPARRGMFVVTLANCGTAAARRVRVSSAGKPEMVGTVAHVPPGAVVHVHVRCTLPLADGGAAQLPSAVVLFWYRPRGAGRRSQRVGLDRGEIPGTFEEMLDRGFVDNINHYDMS